MKRLCLFTAILLMSLAASAEYSFLVFTTDDGETCAIATSGLSINVKDGNIVAENGVDDPLTLPVASLASMEFSENGGAGISDATTGINGAVELYTLDGIKYGQFDSFDTAFQALSPGTYLLKKADGQTIKIIIGK